VRAEWAAERNTLMLAALDDIAKAEGERDAIAAELDIISTIAEQEREDAQLKADAVIADLGAGNLRLRQHWQGCQATAALSAATASAGQSDAAEQGRRAGSGDLVRLAAEWDAKERGLHAVIRADRGARK